MDESKMMVKDTTKRLGDAVQDLRDLLVGRCSFVVWDFLT